MSAEKFTYDRDSLNACIAANFRQWARFAYWKRNEAAALTLQINPHWSDAKWPAELRDQLWEVQELIMRAQIAGELSDPMLPIDFVEWAKNKLALPKDLIDAVEAQPTPRLSLRGLRSENDELGAENQRLKLENDQLKNEKELHPRKSTTLYLIAYGYAVKLGYKPGTRNSAATDMRDELTRLGIGRHEDTLRDIIDLANKTANDEKT